MRLHFQFGRRIGVGVVGLCLIVPFAAAEQLRSYESKYYTLSSDFDPAAVKDLLLHLDHLAAAYNETFPTLRGSITRKYKVLVCGDAEAFKAAAPGTAFTRGYHNVKQTLFVQSANVFDAMPDLQNYGFLQFSDVSIGSLSTTMPPWLLVGLSKYYKYSVFTGDSFCCGMLPGGGIEFLQQSLRDGKFRPTSELMAFSIRQALGGISDVDSHHAWSLVIFLDRAENGKYHDAFAKYLHDACRGVSHKDAWAKEFGNLDIDAPWKKWISSLNIQQTHDEYAQATAQLLAAYMGRAALAGQKFTDVPDLVEAIRSGTIKTRESDWLGNTLPRGLKSWLTMAGPDTKFEIGSDPKGPQIIATTASKKRIVATFNPAATENRTTVEIDVPGRPRQPAKPVEVAKTTITIKSARFGNENAWVDVTEKCQKMIAGDLIVAPNGLAEVLGVDPTHGGVNYLDLHLIVKGAALHLTVADQKVLAPLRLTTQLPD